MTITLYTCLDNNNVISKLLNEVETFDGALRKETSILTPSITINTDYVNVNYAYIHEWNRYYFIEDITSIRDGLIEIKMRVDSLMSYKDSILELECLVERQENFYNLYIDDEKFICENRTQIQTLTFGNGFNQLPTYLLTTVGGA